MQNQLQTEEQNTLQAAPAVAREISVTHGKGIATQTTRTADQRFTRIQKKTRRARILSNLGERLLNILIKLMWVWILIPSSLLGRVPNLWPMLLFGFVVLIALPVCVLPMIRKPRWSAEELVGLAGINALPTLLDALGVSQRPKSREAIYTVLIQLLPQLKASEANLLNRSQRKMLHGLLGVNNGFNPTNEMGIHLRLAILQAIQQIGDESAVPAVKRWAKMKTKHFDLLTIKEAAIECLKALQVHSGELDATKTLLRASQPDAAAPETLLRPVSSGAETAQQQLLRAAQSGENTPSV